MNLKISEDAFMKFVRSEHYNYDFDKVNGNFARWGKVEDDDPEFAPGPEILDFEVTTICDHGCAFCYKSNTKDGFNTSFEDFKMVLDKMPRTLTQVAFGVDAGATSNPDLDEMMWYARSKGIIPNVTVAKITSETAKKLADVCGAVAVSRYANEKDCYDSIAKLAYFGLQQVNIHVLVSQETEQLIWDTFKDYLAGSIPGLNAIVLLGLKQKGRGEHFNSLTKEQYSVIINYALDNNIPIGADSCSGPKLISAVKGRDNFDEIYQMVDPCESTLFSAYVDEKCVFYPCSFMPKTDGWEAGLHVKNFQDFSEIWNHPKTKDFRKTLIGNKDCNGCRECPVFVI